VLLSYILYYFFCFQCCFGVTINDDDDDDDDNDRIVYTFGTAEMLGALTFLSPPVVSSEKHCVVCSLRSF